MRELKLNLSEEKTLITHTRDSAAKFLGYEITTIQSDTKQTVDKNGHKGRSVNGKIGLKVPRKVIEEKSKRYMRMGKPAHRAELLNESDYTIIATYQLEYRGLVNYYRMAYNLHTLQKLKRIMEISLTKTLAHKHKMSVRRVYEKYKTNLEVCEKTYKGLQVQRPTRRKEATRRYMGRHPTYMGCQSVHSGSARTTRVWRKIRTRKKAPRPRVCEQCGATRMTDQIEVHHIRALKDLEKYTGREKPQWVKIMAARKRKTLVLCRTCHMDIQYGRPLKRKVSRSRTGVT